MRERKIKEIITSKRQAPYTIHGGGGINTAAAAAAAHTWLPARSLTLISWNFPANRFTAICITILFIIRYQSIGANYFFIVN